MAAFASCRRSGWVRLLVVILCAFFIFATLAAPPAQALGVESVAVFGLASVLSAATAALGFKLSSNEQGHATLQRMVQDFKTVAWATGFVLVGSKLNGLQNGMDYIKMQVQNGKTYLDSRVFAWVQQWLAENGVYDSGIDYSNFNKTYLESLGFSFYDTSSGLSSNEYFADLSNSPVKSLNGSSLTSVLAYFNVSALPPNADMWNLFPAYVGYGASGNKDTLYYYYSSASQATWYLKYYNSSATWQLSFNGRFLYTYSFASGTWKYGGNTTDSYLVSSGNILGISNLFNLEATNSTGLSGTDTLGKDVVDLTLDQILQKLKEWAQDWFDAGADSATNAATGALDLPLTVSAGAATSNPSIAEDGPLVWFPPFSVPVPNLRTGETDTKTVDQGKENASAAETSTVDVAENQSVIDSLVNWALNYISPDTGLFSKFPLCVPYDAYLLVTSSLGVGAVDSDSIFGASPGDLDGVVNQDIETYSDFQPIINIKHDFQLDGATYPIELTIDLTPWQPLVTFFREGMALLLVAELIGAEFKRIRGH